MTAATRSKSVDTAAIRRINSKSIVEAIRTHGPVGRGDIAGLTGLSFTTVCRVLDDLIAQSIVSEVGAVSIGGARRKTALVDMNASGGWIAAIDIRANAIRSAAVDYAGNVHHSREIPLDSTGGEESVAPALIGELNDLRERAHNEHGSPTAVGVSCAGIVEPDPGIVKLSFNLGLREFPLARIVGEASDVPVVVSNDVLASALAEARLGPGREHSNFAYVNAGTGVGAGIVMGGKVQQLPPEAEFGLMVVALEGDPERFGGRGYLESVASGAGIAAAARREIHNGRKSALSDIALSAPEPISARAVLAAAQEGDELATEIVGKATSYLGIAIVSFAHALGLTMFVLGGELSQAGDVFWDPLRETVARYEFWPGRITLEHSKLQENAALLGVAMLALDKALDARK